MSEEITARYTDRATTRHDGRGNKECPLCGQVVFEGDIEEYHEASGVRRIECCTECREEFEFDNDISLESDELEKGVFEKLWEFAIGKCEDLREDRG
jgi:CRISPR/Cas system-associated protein Cas10 (large subunit of type III CRISPR-Cas system)